MKFTLEIELGNELMRTGCNVGEALKLIGIKFMLGEDGPDIRDMGKIRDFNGNTVGIWKVG